ncbi:phosphate/phosphite/phosphonate ABC transporter substrate-binding protein [Halopseudomonas xiamenensis]|uniref:phosphate/phosphite/phosphonate ABC transporter substrate-binding protein n=1 Tax=Halopseudomonas xiamenensis TaxID=157792 RepID=UPI001626CF4A|nr:phosphate/phosphite/phosphonate ABC transporter substrate-binding protein [Halopseudomonas xiamenensis]
MKLLLVFLWMLFYPSTAIAEAVACRQDSLRISIIPVKNIDELVREYQPLADMLSAGLDLPVQILRASSYASVIDATVSGGTDIALLGPASYLLAWQQNPRIEAFASLALGAGYFSTGGGYYHSLLLVRGDSEFRTLEDTRGRRVVLNDPASTSGALVPNREFPASAGRPLDAHFAGQIYAGSHDKALDALLQGRVEAAFVSSERADEYLRRGLIDEKSLRVLWRSAPIHYDPFVFSAEVCPLLKERIRSLMHTPSAQVSEFLRSQRAERIIPVSHAAYQPLLELMAR